MSNFEVVAMELTEMRDLLRFLYYPDIFNKLLLLLQKHSFYVYAICLIFP